MKIKSKGLGRRELVMDFRDYELRREGDELVVEGTITEPVTWDFSIRMAPSDIPGMLHVGLSAKTFGLGLRWAKNLIFGRRGGSIGVAPDPPVARSARAASPGATPLRPVRPRSVPRAPDGPPTVVPIGAADAPVVSAPADGRRGSAVAAHRQTNGSKPPARTAAALASPVGGRRSVRAAGTTHRSRPEQRERHP